MTARNDREAHASLLSSAEWQRTRAGFATQGPYRKQSRRIGRWLLAIVIVGALVRVAIGSLS